jgi:hypothetical protein
MGPAELSVESSMSIIYVLHVPCDNECLEAAISRHRKPNPGQIMQCSKPFDAMQRFPSRTDLELEGVEKFSSGSDGIHVFL